MYVSANLPSINYNKYSSNVKRVASPSFQGALNNSTSNRVLDMLKEKVTSVKTCSRITEIKPIIDSLTRSTNNIAPNNSIGMMVIPERDLADFLGKEASNFDTKNYRGICIAIGDKYGPVETWQKCYEAITVLLPKTALGFQA